jgi:hypothetical protein
MSWLQPVIDCQCSVGPPVHAVLLLLGAARVTASRHCHCGSCKPVHAVLLLLDAWYVFGGRGVLLGARGLRRVGVQGVCMAFLHRIVMF